MSACPNWRELLAPRFERSPNAEPEGLAEALAHFDACPACRREACRVDPTLVFRRLPAAELDFDLEAERMMLAVAGMRASERVERVEGRAATLSRHPLSHPISRRLRGQGLRWALAAGLAGASLLLGGRGEWAANPADSAGRPQDAAPLAASDGAGGGGAMPARFEAPAAVESAVEDLGRPDARIYQLDGERLSVVMIVDEKLDV
ncbi:MAG: hypothetical protein ABJC13_16500 [Acidobacteriota bacterium]